MRDSESGEDNVLHLSHIVECPSCHLEFEAGFSVEAIDIEQVKEVPDAVLPCPQCGTEHSYPYEGFTQYGYS